MFIFLDTTNTTNTTNTTTANTTNTTTTNTTNTTNTTTTNATNTTNTTTTPVVSGPSYTYPYKITLKGDINSGFEIKAVIGDINYERYLKIDTTSSEIKMPCGASDGYYNPFFSN